MSDQGLPLYRLTRRAAEAIQARQAVAHDGRVAPAGSAMLGLAFTDAAAGEDMAVDVLGVVPATAGAAIAVGDPLEVGPQGKLVPEDTGVKVARAMTAAAGDGRVVQVSIIPN